MSLSKGRIRATIKYTLGRHIVYCEGTKTEPNYVNNIKKHLDSNLNVLPKNDGIVVNTFSKGHATIDLIKKAQENLNYRRNKCQTIDYVWFFFDKDSFNDFAEACKLIESKNKNEYKNVDGFNSDEWHTTWKCCWSNECFEVWIYFHFENLSTALPRSDYIPKINGFIRNKGYKTEYNKNIIDMYDFILQNGGDINKAIKYAKRKDVVNKTNPSTGIYEFVEYFKICLNI